MKRVLTLLVILFCASAILGASEFGSVKAKSTGQGFFANLNRESALSFNNNVFAKSDIVPYRSRSTSADWSRRSDAMFTMGVAGAIVFGVSFPVWISGVVLCAYSYYYLLGGALSLSIYNLGTGGILYYAGAALISLGQLMFWVGLPLMIVGFVLAAAFKNKAGRTAMFFEPSYKENESADISYGLAIKL